MPQTANASRGILIAGDSTVDWFIAEPLHRIDENLEARYTWTMLDGPGITGDRKSVV